jgi:hypothetical protein
MTDSKLTKIEALPGEPCFNQWLEHDGEGWEVSQPSEMIAGLDWEIVSPEQKAKPEARDAWEAMAAKLNINADLAALCEEMLALHSCDPRDRCELCRGFGARLAEIVARLGVGDG